MKKENIEQIVRELFRENFNMYPASYPLTEDGLMTDEGAMNAQDVAKGYYRERTELDIERDVQAGVTEIDYVDWVMAELESLVPEAPTTVEKAAKHFIDLYSDEKANITKDSIHEWWGQTKDQYEGVEYDDVERKILSNI